MESIRPHSKNFKINSKIFRKLSNLGWEDSSYSNDAVPSMIYNLNKDRNLSESEFLQIHFSNSLKNNFENEEYSKSVLSYTNDVYRTELSVYNKFLFESNNICEIIEKFTNYEKEEL